MRTDWSRLQLTDVNAPELELEHCCVVQDDRLIGAVDADKTVQLEACSALCMAHCRNLCSDDDVNHHATFGAKSSYGAQGLNACHAQTHHILQFGCRPGKGILGGQQERAPRVEPNADGHVLR